MSQEFKQLLQENQKQTVALNKIAGIQAETRQQISEVKDEVDANGKDAMRVAAGEKAWQTRQANLAKASQESAAKQTEDKREQFRMFSGILDGIKGMGKSLGGFVGGMKEKIKKGMPSFESILMGAGAAALLAFMQSPLWDKTVKLFKEEVLPALQFLWDNVLQPLGEVITGVFIRQWENIKGLFDGIGVAIDFFQAGDILGGIEALIDTLFDFFFNTVDNALTGVYNLLGKIFGWESTESVWAEIKAVFGDVVQWFKDKFNWLGDTITGGWTSFTGWIQEKWDAVTGWFSEKFTWATDGIAAGWTSLSDWVGGKVDTAIAWIKGLFSDPVAMLDSLKATLLGEGGIVDLLFSPIDKAIAWIQGVFKWGDPENPFSLKDTITGAIDTAIEWVKTLFADPKEALQQFWTGLVGEGGLIDILTSPIDKAIAWVQGIFNWGDPEEPFKVSTFIKDVFKTVKDWFTGLWSWGDENGRDAKGDFDLVTLISNAITAIWDWFKGLLDIDVKKIAESIPGASTLLDWMTTSEDEAQAERMSDIESASRDVGTESWHESQGEIARDLENLRALIAEENAYRLEKGSREMLQLGENGQVIVVPAPAPVQGGGSGGDNPRTRTVPVGVVDGDSTTRAMVEATQ